MCFTKEGRLHLLPIESVVSPFKKDFLGKLADIRSQADLTSFLSTEINLKTIET